MERNFDEDALLGEELAADSIGGRAGTEEDDEETEGGEETEDEDERNASD